MCKWRMSTHSTVLKFVIAVPSALGMERYSTGHDLIVLGDYTWSRTSEQKDLSCSSSFNFVDHDPEVK